MTNEFFLFSSRSSLILASLHHLAGHLRFGHPLAIFTQRNSLRDKRNRNGIFRMRSHPIAYAVHCVPKTQIETEIRKQENTKVWLQITNTAQTENTVRRMYRK